jgi:hypothetical protein
MMGQNFTEIVKSDTDEIHTVSALGYLFSIRIRSADKFIFVRKTKHPHDMLVLKRIHDLFSLEMNLPVDFIASE